MQLNNCIVITLLLIAKTCGVKSVVTKTPRRDELTNDDTEDLIKIIKSCYGDRINAVGLSGDSPDTLTRRLSEELIPAVLIDSTTQLTQDQPIVPLRFRQKLQFFVIISNSPARFQNTFHTIKYSMWWNHMASFFILDLSHKCIRARVFLYLAWKHNMLNAIVICPREKREKLIVAYNPFTSWAPRPWSILNSPTLKRDPAFTWFVRHYEGNEAICANLYYDKTKILSGHAIRIKGRAPDEYNYAILDTWSIQFLLTNLRILHTALSALNATCDFSRNEIRGIEIVITEDIDQVPYWLQSSWTGHRLMSYPYDYTGLVLISQFRGHKTQLAKILSVIDVDSRLGLGIVYLITFVFLKFFVRQAFVPALLNLVRITCDTGFENLPNGTAPRLYLTSLLFVVVTMQGIYQGNLAALLTTAIPLRNINTIKDLVDLNYNIYGLDSFRNNIDNPDLKQRYIRVKRDDFCITKIVHDSSGACITFAQGILDIARKSKLHVSKKSIEGIYTGFEIRSDWPLDQRVYEIIAKMVEADILQPWDIKCNPNSLNEFEFDDVVKKNQVVKKIELVELVFAFVILGIGLVCATIIFIVEVAIHRYKSRIVNVRVQILN